MKIKEYSQALVDADTEEKRMALVVAEMEGVEIESNTDNTELQKKLDAETLRADNAETKVVEANKVFKERFFSKQPVDTQKHTTVVVEEPPNKTLNQLGLGMKSY